MSSTKAKEDYLSYLNNYKMGLVTWHRGRTMSLVYTRDLFNTYRDYMEQLRQTSYAVPGK